jgi:hypothetical protein
MKTSIILFVLLVSAVNSWGWWDKSTHKILTENAANRYFNPIDFNYLEKDLTLEGSTKKATFWLQDGSELEDESNILGIPTRSLNHFHNPTKPLATAGLDDTFSGMSALVWAQAPTEQAKVPQGGNWTWQRVREHQYNYLTALDQTSHDANQARMLKGLGYQMHLVQDMSQPNHVRNDAHIVDGMGMKTNNGFETWAKSKDEWIKELLSNPATIIPDVTVDLTKSFAESALAPIPVARLFDTREHLTNGVILPSKAMSQGLAEYTNANFFSEDTAFAAERYSVGNSHYFPYPKKDETDLQDFIDQYMDPVPDTANGTNYLKYVIKKTSLKTSGESLACLAMPGPNTLAHLWGQARLSDI